MPFATTQAASTMATTQPCAGARLVGMSTMTLVSPLSVKTRWHPARATCCSTN
uniref:Alternative protein USP21 n=1 Tax=Homo sapiens TaxID=9606 RepID=L8E8G0_HUMAN|nr:alternative protein USP21 [Homo sapiens]